MSYASSNRDHVNLCNQAGIDLTDLRGRAPAATDNCAQILLLVRIVGTIPIVVSEGPTSCLALATKVHCGAAGEPARAFRHLVRETRGVFLVSVILGFTRTQ